MQRALYWNVSNDCKASIFILAFDTSVDMSQSATVHPIGVVTVYMARPWSVSQFLTLMPKFVQKVHVLDLTSDDFESSPPALFLDVAGSFHSNSEIWVSPNIPELVSMKYKGSLIFQLSAYALTSLIIYTQEVMSQLHSPDTLSPVLLLL